jgi:hypothetical protein
MTVDVGKFLLHRISLRGDVEFSIALLAKLDIEKGFRKIGMAGCFNKRKLRIHKTILCHPAQRAAATRRAWQRFFGLRYQTDRV